MRSRLHNREETPFASSAEDLFAFSLCPSLFCVFSSPSPPAFSKYHQTPSCHLVAHPVGKGEGAHFVEGDRSDFCHRFNGGALVHQAATKRSIANRGNEGRWRRQDHHTRAEHNRDGNGMQNITTPPDQCPQDERGRCVEL